MQFNFLIIDWSNDWGNNWENDGDLGEDGTKKSTEDKEASKSLKVIDKTENWFEKFFLSFSPFGNLAVIANNKNVVICKGKWDLHNQTKFEISSRIDLKDNEKWVLSTKINTQMR